MGTDAKQKAKKLIDVPSPPRGPAAGGGYSDTANAHNARQADSFHVYYYANVHGDSMWAYYIGAHGGHVVVFGDSTVLSSHTYFGAKVLHPATVVPAWQTVPWRIVVTAKSPSKLISSRAGTLIWTTP